MMSTGFFRDLRMNRNVSNNVSFPLCFNGFVLRVEDFGRLERGSVSCGIGKGGLMVRSHRWLDRVQGGTTVT